MNAPLTQTQTQTQTGGRVVGESLVWLTAMGLAIGLVMVAGLLLLILCNGIAVFWPRQLVQFSVHDHGATSTVLGVVVKQQRKADGTKEVQIRTGNKDAYPPFRYLDDAAIVARSVPLDAMLVERMEYGNAVGFPVALRVRNEGEVPASDGRFADRLKVLVDEVAARRDEIRRLEKDEIGANARAVSHLQIHMRALIAHGGAAAEIAAAKAEIARLQAAYVDLAARAKALEELQHSNQLVLRLAGGESRVIPLGQVVDFHFPNQLDLAERCFWFVCNLWHFVADDPREANTEGGIFPAIFGTFVMTLLMSIAVTPFGVIAAIYLREYARQGLLVRAVRIAVNNLAGVPSIVFGVFGLGFFVYIVGGNIDQLFFSEQLPNPTFGTGGILWAALTLALMTVPVVIVATEEAVAAVPRGAREGSLACGASKWQTIQRIVLPASLPGILTGLILAMARGAGEVAPLMLVGVVKLAPSLPIDGHWNDTDLIPFVHLDQKFMHLGFHIYDLGFQSPDSDAAKPMVFATTLFLIGLVMALNLGAIILREKLRRRFATSAF
jgi:phosphate transport system permease protein